MTAEQSSLGTGFLLAEYQEISQEFRRTREEGIERLNFLITLTSSILAGLIVLAEVGSLSPLSFQLIAAGALVFLIIVAWGVFEFTIIRDTASNVQISAHFGVALYLPRVS